MADSAQNGTMPTEKTIEESAPKRAKFARWHKTEQAGSKRTDCVVSAHAGCGSARGA